MRCPPLFLAALTIAGCSAAPATVDPLAPGSVVVVRDRVRVFWDKPTFDYVVRGVAEDRSIEPSSSSLAYAGSKLVVIEKADGGSRVLVEKLIDDGVESSPGIGAWVLAAHLRQDMAPPVVRTWTEPPTGPPPEGPPPGTGPAPPSLSPTP
jgi:hypothetical protein